MSRKKMSSAKPKKAMLTLAEKMEKDFKDMPAKLAVQYRNELSVLKLQQKKMGAQLKKAKIEKKATDSKKAALSKMKVTATSKKKIMAAKKASEQAVKMIKNMMLQLEQISKTSKALVAKQNKFTQLSKQITLLDKQLSKTPTPRKVVKARKKTISTSTVHETIESTPSVAQTTPMVIETVETN